MFQFRRTGVKLRYLLYGQGSAMEKVKAWTSLWLTVSIIHTLSRMTGRDWNSRNRIG